MFKKNYNCTLFLLDENSNIKNHLNSNKWLIELTNGKIVYVDYRNAFIPINPAKGFQFSTVYTPGTFYKILYTYEYLDFLELGFYAGNEYERYNNFIMLQTAESVATYKQLLCPTTQCYILTLCYMNLYLQNSEIMYNQGIVFSRHTIFFKNVTAVGLY